MTDFGLSPNYSIKFYRDDLYKVIRFNSPRGLKLSSVDKPDKESEDDKFASSIARAKSVIQQVALCNDWDWFVTFTVDRTKYNRYMFKPFYKSFSQWIRDYRKKYGCRIEYLLIPEQHKDGAWHIHGLVRGIPSDHITPFVPGIHPQDLINKGYMNWGRYAMKFGFSSLAPVRDPVKVAFYVTKYITKDLLRSNNSFGAHLYMCSIGLRRAISMGYVYGRYIGLDKYISTNGSFCDCGWANVEDWTYFLDYLPVDDSFGSPDYLPYSEDSFIEIVSDYEQMTLFDLGVKRCV